MAEEGFEYGGPIPSTYFSASNSGIKIFKLNETSMGKERQALALLIYF
jgi:hypothetical protein